MSWEDEIGRSGHTLAATLLLLTKGMTWKHLDEGFLSQGQFSFHNEPTEVSSLLSDHMSRTDKLYCNAREKISH